jgi:flavoprotein
MSSNASTTGRIIADKTVRSNAFSNAFANTITNASTITTSKQCKQCKQCNNSINNNANQYKGFDCVFCSNYCRSIFSEQIFEKDYNLLRYELWFK